MTRTKEKAFAVKNSWRNSANGYNTGLQSRSFVLILTKERGFLQMNKKINLILGSILLGVLVAFLPTPIKLGLFISLGVVLFMNYDEWTFQERGAK